ncbi:hypothetical protein K8I31_03960 [bacterium]|nr:hypothetical protein [bacterium]
MKREILYRVLLFLIILAVPIYAEYIGIYRSIIFVMVCVLLLFFFKRENPLNYLKPKYRVRVRVFEPNGEPADDAVVRCTLGVEGERRDDGWVFEIARKNIPTSRQAVFHTHRPGLGQCAEVAYTFGLNDAPKIELNLIDVAMLTQPYEHISETAQR